MRYVDLNFVTFVPLPELNELNFEAVGLIHWHD
jgi:hypothetical protein